MCATASDNATEQAAVSAEPESRTRLEVLELRADEVIEVARAARKIKVWEQLRSYVTLVQGKPVLTRRAMADLQGQCCNPRLIAALMLYAADHPDWAWCNFWAAFCPEMPIREMARKRKISAGTVKYWLKNVELPWDVYEFVPENR